MLNRILIASAVLACLLCTPVSASVISGTNVAAGAVTPSDPFQGNYGMGVLQEPTGNVTGIQFKYTGTTLQAVLFTVDEASDWYLTQPGDIFSAASIAAHSFPVLFLAQGSQPFPVMNIPLGDFYLGINTGVGVTPGIPGVSREVLGRGVFGWLHLNNTGTELIAVGNAMAYGEQGIIIGTTHAVPEPSYALGLLAFMPLLISRARRSA